MILSNQFSNKIHQILLGSLLGDMYCRKECLNSNIFETNSINQKNYLEWKYLNLKEELPVRISSINNLLCKAKGKIYTRKPGFYLISRISKNLNMYHNLFYSRGNKTINESILKQLDSLGLAVWYCDDGYYDPENKSAQLHTEGFSIKENKLLKKWFKERYNIKVNFKKDPSKKKVLLRFPVKDTNKFLHIVKEHIFDMPDCMWYKLGHLWEGNKDKIKKARLNKIRRNKIYNSQKEVKIKRNEQVKKYYRKNRKKILEKKREYHRTQKFKKYIKEYRKRPYVKERLKEIQKKYRQNPKNREKYLFSQKEYNKKRIKKKNQNEGNPALRWLC